MWSFKMVLELIIVLHKHNHYLTHPNVLNVFSLHLAEFQVTPGRRTVKTFSQGNRWISEDQRKAVEDVTENKISYLSECNCNL